MAEGSQKFAWKLFPGARKICRQCGKEPLRIEDVGETRRLWPSQETQFLCKTCMQEKVDAAVVRRRKELGLSERHT